MKPTIGIQKKAAIIAHRFGFTKNYSLVEVAQMINSEAGTNVRIYKRTAPKVISAYFRYNIEYKTDQFIKWAGRQRQDI